MQIIKSLENIKDIPQSAITIGNFDGVHKGHQVLINKTIEAAKKNGLKSIVFTFENHPVNFFKPGTVKNIITNEDKLNIFESMGVDITVMIPFNKFITTVEPLDYLENILLGSLNMKYIVIGHDFTFGKEKKGNPEYLRNAQDKYGFGLEVIEPITIRGERISSTHIRKLITNGRADEVKEYLGRNYVMSGEVLHSKKLGRTIGFPTANTKIDDGMLCPEIGIYASQVRVKGKMYYGATNIGYNPTVKGDKLSLETYILDFDEDIYGEIIDVEFLEKIRDEVKFDDLEGLKNRLALDVDFVRENYVCKKK